MKYKLSICKINMIGEPVLVLGFCRYDDDDAFWEKYQLFTIENYVNSEDQILAKYAKGKVKYHGDEVNFESIGKSVKIKKEYHDFDLSLAEPLEMTKAEWELLSKELNRDEWEVFDSETWGK